MGIALSENRLAISTKEGVETFVDSQQLAKTYPKMPEYFDTLYYPTCLYKTDFIDMHDISYTKYGIVGVNTAYSCLIQINDSTTFTPIWKPPFITKFENSDLCHLNGMAVDEKGEIRYITAFGQNNTKEGWRATKYESGILMDIETNKTVLDKLPMPHSPRIYKDELYMLLSGSNEVIKVDIENNSYEVIAKLDGYVRGLAIDKDYIFVGISDFRHKDDLPPDTKKDIKPGIVIINKNKKEIEGVIEYQSDLTEIYDIQIVSDRSRVNIFTDKGFEYRGVVTPEVAFWQKKKGKRS